MSDVNALSNEAIWRILRSLLASELAQLRGTDVSNLQLPEWNLQMSLQRAPLMLDSLEHLHLAGVVNRFFHLHESGLEDYLLRYKEPQQWVEVIRQAREKGSGKISVSTSGSTGEPSICTHEWAELQQEVEFFASRYTDRKRLINDCPPHHLYGFIFSVLVAEKLQIPVIERYQPGLAQATQLERGDLVIGFPQRWQFLLASQTPVPDDCKAVSSAAPCPEDVMQRLRTKFSEVMEVYGASETSGVGWRKEPGPYQLLPHWQGKQVLMQDHVEWYTAETFVPLRRLDGAVQVGGVNVFPSRVRQVLLNRSEVKDCAIRAFDKAGSTRLKAFVVFADDVEHDAEFSLRSYAAEQLSSAERPQHYKFGTSLPRNSLGKLSDWSLD
ncbi:4-coumarate--CoA ligase [Aliidiomarina minuta]|uniref:4-coumarate--CoA ligase n=1 Tax=Aliidiomarina minuta TaxID=880057 RepID=A0A432WA66_9GAMM|nr:AMP-binding protein [Aliidiomarina minuta]RUO26925.1 4-coumarate--CoA ligase [Aliidiomarina minuta]